jgi:hypothetical protein
MAPAVLRQLNANPPAAVVIDLSRLPAQGRDMGLAVRHGKSTRAVPLVFFGGDVHKVGKIKQQLPDAEYATWRHFRSALKRAIANPPADPTVPASLLAGYAGTPLPKKLGIKEGFTVTIVGAPPDVADTLGELPTGTRLKRQLRGRSDLIIWFVRSKRDLERRIGRMAGAVGSGGMWIAWPKKTSGVVTDLTQVEVRRLGLASGLVDYKICAIDQTWSGLKFALRKSGSPRRR